MDLTQSPSHLSKRERRELRRQQHLEAQHHELRKRTKRKTLRFLLIALPIAGVFGLLIWFFASQPAVPEGDIVARGGLHWHPELTITIKGVHQTIPANIGIGAAHKPIHTHDDTGVIHLEFEGRVTKDDIRLSEFFKIWGKRFSSTCIFDYCNGADGSIKMFVNGKENSQFDQYEMHDKDRIEIRYE